MSNTVHVKGISSQTSEGEVRDFFSFCGKIQSLSVTPESNDAGASKSASVTFEKETAAKTALLLDNTQLGPVQVSVTAAKSLDEVAGGKTATSGEEPIDKDEAHMEQEDKPRSRILAEYLAHGYVVSDKAIERAISLDQQHGVSHRFLAALNNFDQKYKVWEKTQHMDQKYGVSTKAQQGWLGLSSYFEKAASTPTGQKLRSFYEQRSKQVLDVHNEARHLAALKNQKEGGMSSVPTTEEAAGTEKTPVTDQEKSTCEPGEFTSSANPNTSSNEKASEV